MMLKYFVGPLLGALIGYCTNYIAVKMLFFPKREIKLFGHRLPLTPGAIPKGKPRLAKAAGEVVGKTLLTKEDLEARILSDVVVNEINNALISNLNKNIKDSIQEFTRMNDEDYDLSKERLSYIIGLEIVHAVNELDLATLVPEKGGSYVMEKVQGTMLGMFVNEGMVHSILEPLGLQLSATVEDEGLGYVQPIIYDKLTNMEQETSLELLNSMELTEEKIRKSCNDILKDVAVPFIGKLLDQINISQMVEDKINAMSVDMLEEVVLTVMKKELSLIVNLGALIGFLLGLFNLIVF